MQSWPGQRVGQGFAAGQLLAGEGQRGVALRELRLTFLIHAARIVQHAPAQLAEVAGPERHAREPGNERGLEGVGQDQRAAVVLARELARRFPLQRQLQLAVAGGTRYRAPHLGHARDERQRPGWRQDVERERGVAGVQQLEKRLREDGVADPGRDRRSGWMRVHRGAEQGRTSVRLWPRPLSACSASRSTGHSSSPVFSIGRNTRGWAFHSSIDGMGQCSGRSSAVTSI